MPCIFSSHLQILLFNKQAASRRCAVPMRAATSMQVKKKHRKYCISAPTWCNWTAPKMNPVKIRTGYLYRMCTPNAKIQRMNPSEIHNQRMANMTFSSVYPLYLAKVEKKGRTKEELARGDRMANRIQQ
jgi:hypothetical protein